MKEGDEVTFKCDAASLSFPVMNAEVVPVLTSAFATACAEPTLEYAFGSLRHAFDLKYKVSMVSSVQNAIVLENVPTYVQLDGRWIAVDDRVKLAVESCEEEAASFPVEQSATTFHTTVVLETVEADQVKVCYLFKEELRYADTGFTMQTKAVSVSHFENDAVVVNFPERVLISGHGLSTADKLILASDAECTEVAAFSVVVEEGAFHADITVEEPAASVYMCYKFVAVPAFYLGYSFRASTISRLSLERIINRVPTTFTVEGPVVGDRIAFVGAGEACGSSSMVFTLDETMEVSATLVFPELVPSYADVCYAVNSHWKTLFQLPVLGLSNIVPESIVADKEYTFFVNATHVSGDCEENKLTFSEDWINYGCDYTNNLYTGRLESLFSEEATSPVLLGGIGSNACSSRLGPNGNYIVLNFGQCMDVTRLEITAQATTSDVKTLRVYSAANEELLFTEVLFADNDNYVAPGNNTKSLEFSGRMMKLEFAENRGHSVYTTVRKIALYGHPCTSTSSFAVKYVAPEASCESETEEFPVSVCTKRFTHTFNSSYDEKMVCFKHPSYPTYVAYPNLRMTMKYITGFAGSNVLALGTHRYVSLQGKGIEAGDEVKFVAEDRPCTDNVPVFNVIANSSVLLSGFETTGRYVMCYRFVNSIDSFMRYDNVILNVVEASVLSVTPNLALVNVETRIHFEGSGITESDTFKFVTSDKSCNEETDASTVFSVDMRGYAMVFFTEPLSSGKVCYKFGLSDTFTDVNPSV